MIAVARTVDDPPDFHEFLDRTVEAGHFDNIDVSSTANILYRIYYLAVVVRLKLVKKFH